MIEGWNGFNVLHTVAGARRRARSRLRARPGGRDVAGILAGAQGGEIEVVYLLGADEIDTAALGKAFVIYQGHHGDAGAHRADVILPGAAYTEKNATYVNTEGRVQRHGSPPSRRAKRARIGRSCARCPKRLGAALNYDTLAEVRARLAEPSTPSSPRSTRSCRPPGARSAPTGPLGSAPFVSPIANYYMTDPISRASKTMAECTAAFVSGAQQRTGTHG